MENTIKEGISFIKEWIETKKEQFNDNANFKELIQIIDDIEKEQDFSQDSFEDIRYLLRPSIKEKEIQLAMERWDAHAQNRSVCPIIQFVMNPP